MAKTETVAKTPGVAIARVLRALGLKQGTDFRIRGHYENGERRGTYAAPLSEKADRVIAQNADWIEVLVSHDGHWHVHVSIHRTPNGRTWTWIANYGVRTRETAADAADEPSRAVAEDKWIAHSMKKAGIKSSPLIHPYTKGSAQRWFGSLLWSCEEAGMCWFFQDTVDSPRYQLQAYRGRVQAKGWILYGPGIPSGGCWMGETLTKAAEAAGDRILADRRVHRLAACRGN